MLDILTPNIQKEDISMFNSMDMFWEVFVLSRLSAGKQVGLVSGMLRFEASPFGVSECVSRVSGVVYLLRQASVILTHNINILQTVWKIEMSARLH